MGKGESLPNHFYKPGEAKDKYFTNAIKRYAPNAKRDEIIFVEDFSFSGNGSSGLMFTTEGFATDEIRKDKRARGISTPIRYADLTHISRKSGTLV